MSALPYQNPRRWEEPDTNGLGSLGEVKNYLGLLSSDSKHFYPKKLIEVLSPTDLSKMLGISRSLLYSNKIPLKDAKLKKRIIQLVIATDLAYELLGKNVEKTYHWMTAPNLILFGDTPFEVIMRDEGDSIISWLMERRGLKPGPAF